MKNRCLVFVAILSVIILPSCEKVIGEGPVVTENRSVSSFDELSVSVESDAYFTQGNVYKLEIDAQQNILNEIESVIINNELKIRFRHPNIRLRNYERIKIRVTAPEVKDFKLSGSGNLEIQQPAAPPSLRFTVSGSGNLEADEAGTSYVESFISGSGRIKINNGTPNEEKITISGSGDVDMTNVIVKDADTHISGSGNIRLQATEKLKVHISGSGNVYYKGTPAITSSVSGSGSVIKM